MLILDAEQVKFCQVIRKNDSQNQIITAIFYKDILFSHQRSFEKHENREAIQYCRRFFLDKEPPIPCLLIEDESSYTIWSEDSEIEIFEPLNLNIKDLIAKIDLDKLIADMRNIGGIKIKDRWYRLKVYPRCFIGKEAITWLCDYFKISRTQAVEVAQYLLDRQILHHVVDQHNFEDGYFFYRFYWDE